MSVSAASGPDVPMTTSTVSPVGSTVSVVRPLHETRQIAANAAVKIKILLSVIFLLYAEQLNFKDKILVRTDETACTRFAVSEV